MKNTQSVSSLRFVMIVHMLCLWNSKLTNQDVKVSAFSFPDRVSLDLALVKTLLICLISLTSMLHISEATCGVGFNKGV